MPTIKNFVIKKDDSASELGRGSFGVVYKALHTESSSTVAAKEISLKVGQHMIEQIKRESDILQKIPPHENIIGYIDSVIEDNALWVFMEYCPLQDLDNYCENNDIPQLTRCDIMTQVTRALKHIHGLDPPIVHRDIKPQNILVTMKDKQISIKLTDFGAGKIADMTRSFTTYAGTEDYMAPELFHVYANLEAEDNEINYGLEVDIFSAGLLFIGFFIAIKSYIKPPKWNKTPFGKATRKNTSSLLKDTSCDTPAKLLLNALVRKMTQLDPKMRPTLDEIQDSLLKIKAEVERTLTLEQEFPSVWCDISPITHAGHHSKQPLVQYDFSDCTFEEDPELEPDKFEISSHEELMVYDACKHIIGPEMAKPVCEIEENLISIPEKHGEKKLHGQIHYIQSARTILKTEIYPCLCPEVSEYLCSIGNEVKKSKPKSMELAKSFLKTFNSHFLIGSCSLGGIFETLIISKSDIDSKAFKIVSRDISRAIKNKQTCLGNVSGLWYDAKEILGEAAMAKYKEHINDFNIRITKFGGRDEPETQKEWEESIGNNDDSHALLNYIPLSTESDFKIVPFWDHPDIAKNEQVLAVLTEAYMEHEKSKLQHTNGEHKEVQHFENSCTDQSCHVSKTELIYRLGLSQYVGGNKIKFQNVTKIKAYSKFATATWTDIPWILLERLITLDYRARDDVIGVCTNDELKSPSQDIGGNSMTNLLRSISDEYCPHPVDVFFLVFERCDAMLQQTLVNKMLLCRLAVPLLVPWQNTVQWCIWPLETTFIEWYNKESNEVIDTSLLHLPFYFVSFMRIGTVTFSKSKLINQMMPGMKHDVFCNYDSINGQNKRYISDGLVEMSYYLPSHQTHNHFRHEILFLNLRGDSLKHTKQAKLLCEISSAVIVLLNIEEISKFKDQLQNMGNENIVVILVSVPSQHLMKNIEKVYCDFADCHSIAFISTCTTSRPKSITEIVAEVRKELENIDQHKKNKTIVQCAEHTKEQLHFISDEDHMEGCLKAKEKARSIVQNIQMPIARHKNEMIPLQGALWKEWAELQKKMYRAKEITSINTQNLEKTKNQIEESMTKLRQKQQQLCSKLGAVFHQFLLEFEAAGLNHFFLQFMKIELDTLSRKVFPPLLKKYKDEWTKFNDSKCHVKDQAKQMLFSLEEDLAKSSLGLEHLMRELGQLYEATLTKNVNKPNCDNLANEGASLLLHGLPFEIMDGDAASIPLTWVTAVFNCLARRLEGKSMFILSVVGIQSSGKSTLLNAMFGCEFAVSAGRCTRGVYAQLVPVKEGSGLSFDYLLILDSEGLRAPELACQNYDHDNELATLVIGLADLTLINLKGENIVEMKDVLQIAVHAFMRMKIADKYKRQRCIFVHQNTDATGAGDKLVHGMKKLQENLDEITCEAAEALSCNTFTFSEVITFRGGKDIWYMPNLWVGDVPHMAPINPAYSERVHELKYFIFQKINKENIHALSVHSFVSRVKDIWSGILSDDFVFSFRNSLAIVAHLSLERKMSELKHTLGKDITKSQNVYIGLIKKCRSEKELIERTEESIRKVNKITHDSLDKVKKQIEDFFENTNFIDILGNQKEIKRIVLEEHAAQLKKETVKELQCFHDRQYNTALKYLKEKEQHKEKVLNKAIEHAKTVQGDACPEENEIDEMFETFWKQIYDHDTKIIPARVIKAEMKIILCRKIFFEHEPDKESISIKEVVSLFETDTPQNVFIDQDFLVLDKHIVNDAKGIKGWIEKKGWKKENKTYNIIHLINCEFLSSYKRKIENLCSLGSLAFFAECERFITDSIEKLESCCNESPSCGNLSLTKLGKAKIIARVCLYATRIYKSLYTNNTHEDIVIEKDIKDALKDYLFEDFGQKGHHFMASELHQSCSGYSSTKFQEEIDKCAKQEHVKTKRIDEISEKLSLKLMEICIQDMGFTKPHGNTFVGEIMKQLFGSHCKNFSIKLRVLIALSTTHLATEMFTSMRERFDACHSMTDQMREYKEEVRTFFHNTMTKCTKVVATANLISTKMKEVIMEDIKDTIPNRIENDFKEKVGYAKIDLLTKIMQNIFEEKDVKKLLSYVSNSHAHATGYVKSILNEQAFGVQQRYIHHANNELESLLHVCRNSVTEACKQEDPMSWLTSFIMNTDEKISIHESDFERIDMQGIIDLVEFKNLLFERFDIIHTKLKTFFAIEYENTGDWEKRNPYQKIIKEMWGCKEQCPFCHEPCMKSDPDHEEDHQCTQHRPQGISGWRNKYTQKLIVATCTANVASDGKFKCGTCHEKSCPCEGKAPKGAYGDIYHPYRQYKKYHKNWDIAPDNANTGSACWKWFFCTYKDDLVQKYDAQPPDIPGSWYEITEEKAENSLHEYEG